MCATVRFPGETTYQKREPEWFPPHMNRDSEECWNPVHLYFRMFHQTCFTSSPYSKHVYMPPSPDKRRERLLHSIRWASCRCFIPHEKRESIFLHHLNSWKLSKSALLIWVNVYAWVKRALYQKCRFWTWIATIPWWNYLIEQELGLQQYLVDYSRPLTWTTVNTTKTYQRQCSI
jgi:hypothetical protein